MRCAAALSTHPVPSQATGDVIADLLEYGVTPPEFLLLVTTPEFSGAAEDIISTTRAILQPEELLFVVSAGVLAAGSEVTTGAGLGLWAYWSETPGVRSVRVIPLHSGQPALTDEEENHLRHSLAAVLLGDPGAEDVTSTLEAITAVLPHQELSGGLLSAARGPVRLIDSFGTSHTAVVVTFQSASVVAVLGHGSVPLSEVLTATTVVGTRLIAINEQPALDIAHEVLARQAADTRSHTARDLAIAVQTVSDGSIVDVHRVLGVDQKLGALALTGEIPVGASISFHRQDRDGGVAGLDRTLGGPRAQGSLFFSCSVLDPSSESDAAGELGVLVEALGTAAFAGVLVSTVIGRTAGQVGLQQAPFSAAIFGRDHH